MGVAVGEDAAVGRHEPIAAPVGRRGHADDGLVEPDAAGRTVEVGIAVGEDASVDATSQYPRPSVSSPCRRWAVEVDGPGRAEELGIAVPKIPPSEATSQYPSPVDVAAMPTTAARAGCRTKREIPTTAHPRRCSDLPRAKTTIQGSLPSGSTRPSSRPAAVSSRDRHRARANGGATRSRRDQSQRGDVVQRRRGGDPRTGKAREDGSQRPQIDIVSSSYALPLHPQEGRTAMKTNSE